MTKPNLSMFNSIFQINQTICIPGLVLSFCCIDNHIC